MEKSKELTVAEQLAFELLEKGKRAAELVIANTELFFQTEEKRKRADELKDANIELAFQQGEKRKRAEELVRANIEHEFQNSEKEKRAAELVIANNELIFQNSEKEKRAEELGIANKELIFQNEERSKRSAELIVAYKELAFQNEEKGKRAAELIIANLELAFQNEEKERRAVELSAVNKELEQFAYIASHDLQQPLRTVSNYLSLFEKNYSSLLDDEALRYLSLVNNATNRMSILITSLLAFSQLGNNKKLICVDCNKVISDVVADLDVLVRSSHAIIEVGEMPTINIYEPEMRQLFQNLISNAIKFQKSNVQPKIQISSKAVDGKWEFKLTDNGIGIAPVHFDKIFDIFQRLHSRKEYEGSGIGLANCKKIVQLHHGEIWIESVPEQGSSFYFSIAGLRSE